MRARRGLIAVLTVLWVLLGLASAGPAAAHAELVSSSPDNGAELKSAPTQVRLNFSEAVRPVRKRFSLTDDAGARLRIVEPTGTSRTVVTALPPGLGPGFYLLNFRVISVDNHPIKGSIAFNVGGPAEGSTASKTESATVPSPNAPPPAGHAGHGNGPAEKVATAPAFASGADEGSTAVAALAGVNRWMSYLGAILLLGVAGFVALCWPAGAADRRVRKAVAVGAALVPLAAALALPLQAAQAAGTGFGAAFEGGRLADVVGARYGETLLLRIGFGAALVALLVLLARRRNAWLGAGAGAAGVCLLLTYAGAGHPAAGDHPRLTMSLDAIHLAAVALWVGGLLVLAVRLLPTPPADCAPILQRWSRVATAAVAVLIVTGTIGAARELRSFSALVDTEYGRWILAKSLVLGAMLGLANLGRSRVRRYVAAAPLRVPAGASLGAALADRRERAEVSRLRRSVAGELVLAAAVLVLTAFLTATSPPHPGHTEDHTAAAA